MLDAFVEDRKLEVEMTTHRDMLRNFYFWFTD